MKIELKNETPFRSEDIRALLRKSLAAVGYPTKRALPLTVVIVCNRFRTCVTGRARLGDNRLAPGRSMRLRVPKPEEWTSDTWRSVIAVTVHECMHLVGTEHRDMTEAQFYCTLPIPAWAADLTPFRVVEVKPEPSRAEKTAAARANRLEHAQAMLKKAETRLKRAATIEAKWRRRVKMLERAKDR